MRALQLLICVCTTVSITPADEPTTPVTILAVTEFGEVLTPVRVTRFQADEGRGRDFAASFSGARASAIPYGEYVARVTAGDRVIAGPVRVGREDTLIVLSGPGAIFESGPGRHGAEGTINGTLSGKPVWVRLVRAFSEDVCCTVVPVSNDGKFWFGGVEPGAYVLLVLGDGKILYEGQVRVNSIDVRLTVDLESGRATVEEIRRRPRP